MPAGKDKFSSARMIEFNLVPVAADMAIGTVFAQPPLMRVVLAVTVDALARRIPVFLSCGMATGA